MLVSVQYHPHRCVAVLFQRPSILRVRSQTPREKIDSLVSIMSSGVDTAIADATIHAATAVTSAVSGHAAEQARSQHCHLSVSSCISVMIVLSANTFCVYKTWTHAMCTDVPIGF